MEKSKKVVAGTLAAYKTYSSYTADGAKLTWKSYLTLVPMLMFSIAPILADLQDAGKEWEKSDDAGRADLMKAVKEGFDLADDNLETKIEAGISIAVKLGGLVGDVKALIAKNEVAPAALPAGQVAANEGI